MKICSQFDTIMYVSAGAGAAIFAVILITGALLWVMSRSPEDK